MTVQTKVSNWGSVVEIERARRIRLSAAAYAYEFDSDPIMSDEEFDRLSYEVDKTVETGNKVLDKFFVEHFEPCTGQWIQQHPDLEGIKRVLKLIKEK